MQLLQFVEKSHVFLQQHEREALLVSRCITGILIFALVMLLSMLLFAHM